MKKAFLILLLFIGNYNFIYSYNSNDYININYISTNTPTSIFIVPLGYDLIIQNIESSINSSLSIFNNSNLIYSNTFLQAKNDVILIIKDNLVLLDGNNNIFNLRGVLVKENEDITSIINNTNEGINKNIFTKEDIDFIYLREFVFIIFLMILKFFSVIIGRKII